MTTIPMIKPRVPVTLYIKERDPLYAPYQQPIDDAIDVLFEDVAPQPMQRIIRIKCRACGAVTPRPAPDAPPLLCPLCAEREAAQEALDAAYAAMVAAGAAFDASVDSADSATLARWQAVQAARVAAYDPSDPTKTDALDRRLQITRELKDGLAAILLAEDALVAAVAQWEQRRQVGR